MWEVIDTRALTRCYLGGRDGDWVTQTKAKVILACLRLKESLQIFHVARMVRASAQTSLSSSSSIHCKNFADPPTAADDGGFATWQQQGRPQHTSLSPSPALSFFTAGLCLCLARLVERITYGRPGHSSFSRDHIAVGIYHLPLYCVVRTNMELWHATPRGGVVGLEDEWHQKLSLKSG